jgi:nucleotide-binding universal stress UspA family protein
MFTCLDDELRRMARCLLAVARSRAENEGVVATNVVLAGPVRQTIEEYLRQVGASALVIGAPSGAPTSRAFGSEGSEVLAGAIADATGVETILVS